MGKIPNSLRQLVIQCAKDRCEYCCLSQAGQAATFHIDHIIPVVAGGATTSDNLALACVSCSLRKADPKQSFQPQDSEQNLIDILPFLINEGLTINEVRQGLRSGFSSKPLLLDSRVLNLYDWLFKYEAVKLNGVQLQNLRENNPHLASL